MAFGDPIVMNGANPRVIIMEGDGRILIRNPDTEVIWMVRRDTNHVVDVADESGHVIETHSLTSPGEVQSIMNSLIVKYSWL